MLVWFTWVGIGVGVCLIVEAHLKREHKDVSIGPWQFAIGALIWPIVVLALLSWWATGGDDEDWEAQRHHEPCCEACGARSRPTQMYQGQQLCARCYDEAAELERPRQGGKGN